MLKSMKNSSRMLSDAIHELSAACDMLALDYPTLKITSSIYNQLLRENSYAKDHLRDYKALYGIPLEIVKL